MFNREHISLIIPESGRPRSLRRSWNQLSRFQRNVIFTVLLGLCLTCVLLMRNGSEKDVSNHLRLSKPDTSEEFVDVDESDKRFDKDTSDESNNERPGDVAEVNHVNNVEAPPAPPAESHIRIVPQVQEPQSEELRMVESDRGLEQLNVVEPPNEVEERSREKRKPKPVVPSATIFKGPQNERQVAVVEAFKHAWKGYRAHAWGHDNLKPISGGYSDWFNLGLTIVDALDTIYIMGLAEEFKEARDWVEAELSFEKNQEVNLFETTIRVLGGLLSAYHLTGDDMFLAKSLDLGDRLMPAFSTPSGIPFSDTNLLTLKSHAPRWSPDSSTSEVTTIQLEFRDLSRCTGEEKFEAAIQAVNDKVHDLPKKDGLVPIFINANTGTFRSGSTISLGARGDSYYEYLLKQWLQTGKRQDDYLLADYVAAMEGVQTHLVRATPTERHVYIGELINSREFKPKMDHLTCYLPGTLLLGHQHGMPDTHLQLARDLLETCYQTYMRQPTQLAPEITYFNLKGENEQDMYVKTNDAHNLLRPEFVESLYYFYALTGNRTYQDMGWTIFRAFEKYTRVPGGGYTSIGNVKSVLNTRPRDMMESFFLGETLKYFYLLFSDDRREIDLDKWVFNTEAHVLPIRSD